MAVPSSSSHVRKRQFQPSIDSFFHRHDSASSRSPVSRPLSPLSPALPAETQSSLLSVGMRVRKSVPEGYKTHKTMGQSGFPFPSTAPPASSAPARPSYSSESSRKLAPFCGLHKTGGWAAQPSMPPPSSAPPAFPGRDHYDDMPASSMSQNSLATTQNSFMSSASQSATKKRSRGDYDTYEQDIEDELEIFFDDFGAEEPVSPMAKRVIAQPRGMKQNASAAGRVAIVDTDFDEAPFLAPVEVMEVHDNF